MLHICREMYFREYIGLKYKINLRSNVMKWQKLMKALIWLSHDLLIVQQIPDFTPCAVVEEEDATRD